MDNPARVSGRTRFATLGMCASKTMTGLLFVKRGRRDGGGFRGGYAQSQGGRWASKCKTDLYTRQIRPCARVEMGAKSVSRSVRAESSRGKRRLAASPADPSAAPKPGHAQT